MLLMLAAVGTFGCGGKSSSLPKTFKVTGTVVAKGGAPVTDGAVQFTHVTDTSFSVSGDIEKDGKFTLFTIKGNDRVSGVPEGEYRVMIVLPIPADQKGLPAVELRETFRVEAKDNHLPIDLASLGN
jgi:hypothetical protein